MCQRYLDFTEYLKVEMSLTEKQVNRPATENKRRNQRELSKEGQGFLFMRKVFDRFPQGDNRRQKNNNTKTCQVFLNRWQIFRKNRLTSSVFKSTEYWKAQISMTEAQVDMELETDRRLQNKAEPRKNFEIRTEVFEYVAVLWLL